MLTNTIQSDTAHSAAIVHAAHVADVQCDTQAKFKANQKKLQKLEKNVEKVLTNPVTYMMIAGVIGQVASAQTTDVSGAFTTFNSLICGVGGQVAKGIGLGIAVLMTALGIIYFMTGNRNGTKTILTGLAGGVLLLNLKTILSGLKITNCAAELT